MRTIFPRTISCKQFSHEQISANRSDSYLLILCNNPSIHALSRTCFVSRKTAAHNFFSSSVACQLWNPNWCFSMMFLLSYMVVILLQSNLSESFEMLDSCKIGLYDPGSNEGLPGFAIIVTFTSFHSQGKSRRMRMIALNIWASLQWAFRVTSFSMPAVEIKPQALAPFLSSSSLLWI